MLGIDRERPPVAGEGIVDAGRVPTELFLCRRKCRHCAGSTFRARSRRAHWPRSSASASMVPRDAGRRQFSSVVVRRQSRTTGAPRRVRRPGTPSWPDARKSSSCVGAADAFAGVFPHCQMSVKGAYFSHYRRGTIKPVGPGDWRAKHDDTQTHPSDDFEQEAICIRFLSRTSRLRRLNSEWDYHLYDDEEWRDFISESLRPRYSRKPI